MLGSEGGKAMLADLRVLVVDDDPSILEVLEEYLVGKGFEVTCAAGGPEGLAALEQDPFDLVISDIQMAGCNGFELLHAARVRYPGCAIILMTAYDERYPLSAALQAGADGYLSKPFNLSKFSLIFERAFWSALSRQDWWEAHDDGRVEELHH